MIAADLIQARHLALVEAIRDQQPERARARPLDHVTHLAEVRARVPADRGVSDGVPACHFTGRACAGEAGSHFLVDHLHLHVIHAFTVYFNSGESGFDFAEVAG
ncbi:hypothetical protein ACIBJC_06855 [Streptomyces sp. NPDC050509]|uniref:hypothetical protein n=1 Tax=Streptomyces sp. NPDC050509 TaxID=3365620 RepID=UPI0037A8916A